MPSVRSPINLMLTERPKADSWSRWIVDQVEQLSHDHPETCPRSEINILHAAGLSLFGIDYYFCLAARSLSESNQRPLILCEGSARVKTTRTVTFESCSNWA